MNPAANLPRVHPWIVVTLAVVLALLVVAALLLAIDPTLMHSIGAALHGSPHVADECGGGGVPC